MCAAKIQTQNNDRQDYGLFYSDGLLDIFLGLGFVSAGLLIFVDLIFLIGVFPATMLPAWQAGRKKTLDRMNLNFGGQIPGAYQSRTRAVLVGVMLAGVLAFVLGLGAYFAFSSIPMGVFDWLRNYYVLILGVIIAGVFSACGIALGTPRFHLYAGLTLALFAAGYFMAISMPLVLLVLGLMISGMGVLVLIRFLSEYPAA